jgi:hypothetical protein
MADTIKHAKKGILQLAQKLLEDSDTVAVAMTVCKGLNTSVLQKKHSGKPHLAEQAGPDLHQRDQFQHKLL